MTITAAPAETLTLRCDVCKKPVADQTGYLCVDEIAALCEVPGGSQSGSRRTPARSSTAASPLATTERKDVEAKPRLNEPTHPRRHSQPLAVRAQHRRNTEAKNKPAMPRPLNTRVTISRIQQISLGRTPCADTSSAQRVEGRRGSLAGRSAPWAPIIGVHVMAPQPHNSLLSVSAMKVTTGATWAQ